MNVLEKTMYVLTEALEQSTADVLQSMTRTTAVKGQVFDDCADPPSENLTSHIKLENEENLCSISISVPTEVSYLLISRMLAVEPSMLSNDELIDGVREILNMIAGNVRIIHAGTTGVELKMGLPLDANPIEPGGNDNNHLHQTIIFNVEQSSLVLMICLSEV